MIRSSAEFERDLPFGVFVDALDEYLESVDRRRLDRLGEEGRTELAQVFPSFPDRGSVSGLEGERYRTNRAVRELLERLAATSPMVLILDDLHYWLALGHRADGARAAADAQVSASAVGLRLPTAMAHRAAAAIALDLDDAATAVELALASAALADVVCAPIEAGLARSSTPAHVWRSREQSNAPSRS